MSLKSSAVYAQAAEKSVTQPAVSVLRTIVNYAGVYALRTVSAALLWRQQMPPPYLPKIIRYPYNPDLTCRLFIPSSIKPGSRTAPLWISIHGGGFTTCTPSCDDFDNRLLSERYGLVVLAINYRKAPSHVFPAPVYDCAALIKAALDDPDLPVDHTKVIVAGYSAGATLALTSVQLDGIYDRIKAVVSYYPVADYTRSTEERLQTTEYAPGRDSDPLAPLVNMLAWAYIPVGTYLRNPLLSPIFSDREKLPQHVLIMGCEYDLLCEETRLMAMRLASEESPNSMLEEWTKNGISWKLLKGVGHGFNTLQSFDSQKESLRWDKVVSMHHDVAHWLKHILEPVAGR